jgi:hypothetical protein
MRLRRIVSRLTRFEPPAAGEKAARAAFLFLGAARPMPVHPRSASDYSDD